MKAAPSFRKKLGLTVFRQYRKAQAALHELSYLFWECTLRCNLSCLHCGSDCRKETSVRDMPANDFLNITHQLSKYYQPEKVMIVLTGGEPLLRQDLEYVGQELRKQGYPWGFVTNGILLTAKRFRALMNAGLKSVTVSLDGFKDSHEWLRGYSGGFEKAVDAIRLIVNEPGLVYDVATCISRKNYHQLSDLKEFLIQLGVKKWRIFTIFPTGRAKGNDELDISPEQLVGLMNFLRETRKEGRIRASYGCEGYLGNFETEVRDGYYFCRAGIMIASVLADGGISACPNIHHGFVQGNIYQDDFLKVWDKGFEKFRNHNWMKTGKCADCEAFKFCVGNSMHLREPDNPDPLRCHYEMIKICGQIS